MSILKKIIVFGSLLLVTGCISIPLLESPQVGMTFRSDNWADLTESGARTKDKNPFFLYVGQYKGAHLYKKNPYWILRREEFSGGIVVSNGQIVEVLSTTEIMRVEGDMRLEKQRQLNAENQRREEERNRIRQENADRERERVAESQRLMQRREQERRVAEERARAAREQCLSRGAVGICQSASQNNTEYLCGTNALVGLENIFNPHCYYTDTVHIKTVLEVRNNTGRSIKDIRFICTQYSKSGTALRKSSETIYDVWGPSVVKSISLKFFKHDQVASLDCKASDWK